MPTRNLFVSSAFALAALVVAAIVATPAQATPRPLNDTEMSAIRGADGTIAATVEAPGAGWRDGLSTGLSAAFSSSTGSTLLDAAQFAAALDGTGWTPSMMPGYAGQPVVQTRVDAQPITFSFDASDILQAAGVHYSGPSMGTFTMKDFDARGTTLWVWQHH